MLLDVIMATTCYQGNYMLPWQLHIINPVDLRQPIAFVYEGYFSRMASLHQVASLAAQINNDARSMTNHKYLAHQMALLYVSIQS